MSKGAQIALQQRSAELALRPRERSRTLEAKVRLFRETFFSNVDLADRAGNRDHFA